MSEGQVLKGFVKTCSVALLLTFLDCSAGCDMGATVEIDACGSAPVTSHDFIWRIDTLGDGNSSVLNDVFIVNDTCVWAVGEIYLKDSIGQVDPLPYNAALWNGIKWQLKKIVVNLNGNMITPPLEGVFAFSPMDVWFVGSLPIHGDGQNWLIYDVRAITQSTVSLSRAWGLNSSSMYFVGRNGSVVYYNGSTWFKVASGTTIDIQDIWGGVKAVTGEQQILAVASNSVSFPGARKILRLNASNVSTVADDGLPLPLESVWFVPLCGYWVVGDGVYQTATVGGPWQEDTLEKSFYKYSIRGLAGNDIVTVGGFGGIAHFNGVSWKTYTGKEAPQFFGNYYAVAIYRNLVVAVGGYEGRKGIILMGKR